MSDISIEDKRVITPQFRVSFPAVFEAKAFRGQAPKFQITMLFEKKKDAVKDLVNAANKAAEEKWGAKAPAIVAKLKGTRNWPFHDGDQEKPDMPGYANHIFVTAKAKAENQPGVVDQELKPMLDASKFYAGCYARAEILAYAYDNEFGKGVGFSLQNVQKLGDGEKFGGKRNAEDVFDKVEDLSDDEDSYKSDSSSDADSDTDW